VPWAVAIGVGSLVPVGALRIVLGIRLAHFTFPGYFITSVQTFLSPKQIVPIGFDSGLSGPSIVTVPLVAAHGFGLASRAAGRDLPVDSFGPFAALITIMAVMGYSQLARWWTSRKHGGDS